MSITKPYHRNCRQFSDGSYSDNGKWMYVLHPRYARDPEHYIRAFLIIQKDLLELFDYVEPADSNLGSYSYRIHELLLRASIEVEANCKAILLENGYARTGDWNMGDYKKLNPTHRLSSYEVRIPVWNGTSSLRRPFAPWAAGASLPWYTAYNATKHDRQTSFPKATFEQMLDAICGLVALLSSQFITHDFAPADWALSVGGPNDGMESAIVSYFRVKFPNDWPPTDKYDFDWQVLKNEPDPFANFPYV